MKKLLVVMLMLSMASLANAALKISVGSQVDPADSTITLGPSQTAKIDIWGDGVTPTPQAMWLTLEGPAEMTGGTILYPGTGGLSELTYYQLGDLSEIVEWIRTNTGYGNVTSAYYINLASATTPPQEPLSGTLIDNIILHCTGPADALLQLGNADLTNNFDTQVIHQPEPMTIALLGLGGLFLRRRK